MTASQLTPRANPMALLPEKSLPPPPSPSTPPTQATASTTALDPHSTKTIKALPARPAVHRSWTEQGPIATEAGAKITHAPRSKSSGNTESSLNLSSDSLEHRFFAASTVTREKQAPLAQQRQLWDSASHSRIRPATSQESSPPQAFYSPCLNMQDSAQIARRSVQLSSMSPAVASGSEDRRAPRPSLPIEWKVPAPPTPPRLSSIDATDSPEPTTSPNHLSQHDNSGQSSPTSKRLSSQHAHFSSDYSVRNSSSTHNSFWTERSLASCGTSPACTQSGLKLDNIADDAHSRTEDECDIPEELDESSVGLGITSDLQHDTSSRRSSAAPILPSPMLPGSAQALQGPFSHHRAPSWTRRVDMSPLPTVSSRHRTFESGGGFVPAREGWLRSPTLSVGTHMQRALSDVNPVSAATADIAAAFASASSSSTLASPSIPLRRDSRIRCSSDSANYHSSATNPARHSPSLSVSSSASNSGQFTPGLPSESSGYLGGGDLSVLQSPPRTSSLRRSNSISPSHLSSSIAKDGSQRTPPAQLTAGRRPPRPMLDQITSINQLSDSIHAVQQAPGSASGRDSPSGSIREPPLRTTSAASRARRASEVSITSFLQNGEFSHIVGAYTSKMRWEDGLYDFDESAEAEADESRAVKTAEEGSAAIVQGRDLALQQIEAETGPNTTHLLLNGNKTDGLVGVLERVLPLTTNLLVLDLSNCNLQRLPDAIGSCIALEELDISGNPVGHLPDWILNLRALRILSADRFGLDHLPSSLIQLQELQRLSLRNNRLVFLPSWLHRMSKLSNLFVEGNLFRGPWQDIVAPLLSQGQQRSATAIQPGQQRQERLGDAPTFSMDSGATPENLARRQERPAMSRMRSADDLQKMLDNKFGALTPPGSTLDLPSDESSCVSPQEAPSRPTTGYENRAAGLAYASEADTPAAGGGKWGGFLKKIGRKASSHKLSSAYSDHMTNPSESRFSSPKASRKSLRSSGGSTRSGSFSKGGAAPSMTPCQSELVTPSVALTSLNLAAAVDEKRENPHVPMTPLTPSAKPLTPSKPAMLLQALPLEAEAKKAKRQSFLPVHAFATASADMSPQLGQNGPAAAHSTPQEEMDEESLARHRNRLRALMHYLRDLDDLAAARAEATSFAGPSKSTLANLREAGSHSRAPSVHRPESSNPSTKSRDSGGELVASTAASSISDSAALEPARLSTVRCSKDDSIRRFRIIAEIVSTERTYVKGLSELVDIYVKPAMAPADGNSGLPVIPPSEHRAVFGNVEALLQFHRTVFLPSLVAMAGPVLNHDQDSPGDMTAEETAAVAEKVASVFSTHAAFFKMYTSYVNGCDSAQMRISAWMAPSSAGHSGGLSLRGGSGYSALQAFGALSAQGAAAAMAAYGSASSMISTGSSSGSGSGSGSGMLGAEGILSPSQRKKIRTFMKRCRTHPRHTQLNVESYLLLPVQRIPRYRLLLEDLVKSTDTARLADSDALAAALEHVTQIATKVNESKRQSEQDRRLLAWQYRIHGWIEGPLVQPHRRLLKDGSLQLKRVVRRVPGFVRSNRSASVGALSPHDMAIQADDVLSVDHLQQVTEDQSVALVLCSDIAVLCAEKSRGKDANAPVLLRSMLRLIRPVEILGGVNLRVVDRSEILYLAAASPAEAVAWKTAFDLHFYQ